MWTRYCKQRKLDLFVHFLRCVADIRPPSYLNFLKERPMERPITFWAFRKVALYMCRSLRGGTLFRTLPGRSLHGGDAFFAVKLRKSRKNSENRGKLPNFGHFPRFLRKNSAFRDFFPSKMGCVRGKNIFFFFDEERLCRSLRGNT